MRTTLLSDDSKSDSTFCEALWVWLTFPWHRGWGRCWKDDYNFNDASDLELLLFILFLASTASSKFETGPSTLIYKICQKTKSTHTKHPWDGNFFQSREIILLALLILSHFHFSACFNEQTGYLFLVLIPESIYQNTLVQEGDCQKTKMNCIL